MSSDADKFFEFLAGKLRKKLGLGPLTPEEAEAAYDAAPSVPLPPGRIEEIVQYATSAIDPAKPPRRPDLGRRRMTRCQADDDGDCE